MHPIPASMVPPSKRRPVWRGGIIQIHIGRTCDLACAHCSQGSDLALGGSPPMTPEQFEQAVVSLKGFWGVTGVFGGNPCMSKYFPDYCRILRARVPFVARGLWSNHPRGHGKECRITYNPAHSNLNCHLKSDAYEEFAREWPESIPHLKGMDQDSVHSSPWVAIQDVIEDEAERWKYIGACDVNQFWSAMLCVVHGEVRGYFCELAGAQAMLHQNNPDWMGTGQPMPMTGVPATPGWWNQDMSAFEAQARLHCMACGIPLRRAGLPATTADRLEFSETHRHIARPKVRDRPIEFVTIGAAVERPERPSTQYLPNVTPGYRGE